MAIVVSMLVHGGGPDLYARVDPLVRPPDDPPPGLLWHSAGRAPDGWRILDVWETAEDRERYEAERLGPALETLGERAPTVEVTTYELHNWVRPG